jgi:hypothetical protein
MALGFRPVWALGSSFGIKEFPVLPVIESITVIGEINDGGANHRAAQECAVRWTEAGREAVVLEPIVGDDFNSVWGNIS